MQPPPPEAKRSDATQLSFEPNAKQQTILTMLEKMFGVKFKRMDSIKIHESSVSVEAHAVNASATAVAGGNPASGGGIALDYQESYLKAEAAALSAEGVVETEDGRKLQFSFSYAAVAVVQVDRSASLRTGSFTDPLVLDLGGGVGFGTDPWNFDLDGNGTSKALRSLLPGSTFLAHDRNDDGAINDGRELFGPRSGDGFGELAQLDADRNGWIDESDPGFSQLRLWDGNHPPSLLLDLDIGAIATGRAPFTLDHRQGADLIARSRQAGMYLRQDGTPGAVRQIDYAA